MTKPQQLLQGFYKNLPYFFFSKKAKNTFNKYKIPFTIEKRVANINSSTSPYTKRLPIKLLHIYRNYFYSIIDLLLKKI